MLVPELPYVLYATLDRIVDAVSDLISDYTLMHTRMARFAVAYAETNRG